MSPTPLSPVSKMAQPQRAASQDSSADSIRKRVCKACDRCRLKKSKCDGSHPCSRCKADNAICVFGERKKSHDKVYPKGYVEMLEQQQSQLVSGLQEMYKRLQHASAWNGPALPESNGHPLTHDILAALDLLETKHDGSGELEAFEEDCQKLQSRLIANGAGFTHRRGSFSSDSENSQQGHSRSESQTTPKLSKQPMFKDNFTFSAPSSPLVQSPAPRSRQTFPPAQPSPLQQNSPLSSDPQLYQAEWAFPESGNNAELLMTSGFAMQAPDIDQSLPNSDLSSLQQWDNVPQTFDMGPTSHPQHFQSGLGVVSKLENGSMVVNPMDQMDLEFNQFIQIMT